MDNLRRVYRQFKCKSGKIDFCENLVNLMINVSKDVVKKVPVDKVKALHLRADVNFVAFSVGITIDLDEIKRSERITEKRKNGSFTISIF